MTILWCGGEDTSFVGNALSCTDYLCSSYRSAMYGPGFSVSSGRFGPLTSCWFQFTIRASSASNAHGLLGAGIVNSSEFPKGIWFGTDTDVGGKLAVYTYDGSTLTKLATESGTTLSAGCQPLDAHIVNYGESSTIDVYLDGDLVISFSGDSSISGVSDFDAIGVGGGSSQWLMNAAGFIVSDTDTRGSILVVFPINGAGDTNEFDYGTYADVDDAIISDANQIYTTTQDKLFLSNISGIPEGDYVIQAFKVESRCVDGTGSLGAKLGVKSGGTVGVESTTQNCGGYWQTLSRLMLVNPVTGVPFTPSEIDALQLAIKSGTV